MILVLPVYMRAILKAASLASVPLVAKKNFSSPCGKDFEELCAEAGARGGRVAGRDIGQFARLLGDGLDDARILVAEVDAHQLRGEVEIALARAVGEPAALGIDDVHRFPGLLEAPSAVVELAGEAGDFFGGQLRHDKRVAHGFSSQNWSSDRSTGKIRHDRTFPDCDRRLFTAFSGKRRRAQ